MNGRSISLLGHRFPARLLCFLPAPIYFPCALVYDGRHIVTGRLPDAYRRLGDALGLRRTPYMPRQGVGDALCPAGARTPRRRLTNHVIK